MADEERDRAIDFVIESLAGLAVNDHKQDIQLEKLIIQMKQLNFGWIGVNGS